LAHAALTAASPADGAVVARAPAQLRLGFSEPVSPLVLKLILPDGTARLLDRYALKDRMLVIDAPGGIGDGTHVLSWRVVSEDGHPVGGSVVFSIGAPSAAAPDAIVQADPTVRVLLWATKVGLYLALFLGVGGAAFAAWVGPLPAAARRLSAGLAITGLVLLPLAVAAQGLDALGATFGSLAQPAVWQAGAVSVFGRTTLVAAISIAIGLISLALHGRAGRLLAWVALAGVGLALAASGHASAAAPQLLMRPAVFLHAVGVAAWAGALFPLSIALFGPDGVSVLDRFSRRISIFVAAIFLSGLALSVVQVEHFDALETTEYGHVLLIKLAWVVALFGLAAFNRYRLTAKVRAGEVPAAKRLRRLIATEIILVLLVFGTAALWRFTPPPRALFLAAAQPASVHIHTDKAMADVAVTPGSVGPVTISISLLNGEFGPFPAKEMRIELSNPAAGIEAIERQAVRVEDGLWRVEGFAIPVSGHWTVELEILVSDFEMLRLRTILEIRP
jgi:copper transport protein